MVIAVLSGKGGTGKTLVSVNLAAVSSSAIYIDCDVEEPNGHLYFKPTWNEKVPVAVSVPQVNQDLCTGCRKCTEFCRFHALAYVQNKLLVFEDICHSCDGCYMVCPEGALTPSAKVIGMRRQGQSGKVSIHSGMLNPGEASGVPIIKSLLYDRQYPRDCDLMIDCPPGSACVVMESIKDADYCVLVAEPTIFGVHNLDLVVQLATLFQKKMGVILNKCTEESNPARDYCIQKGITILGSIPYNKQLGSYHSSAEIASDMDEKYRSLFGSLLDRIRKEALNETSTYS